MITCCHDSGSLNGAAPTQRLKIPQTKPTTLYNILVPSCPITRVYVPLDLRVIRPMSKVISQSYIYIDLCYFMVAFEAANGL